MTDSEVMTTEVAGVGEATGEVATKTRKKRRRTEGPTLDTAIWQVATGIRPLPQNVSGRGLTVQEMIAIAESDPKKHAKLLKGLRTLSNSEEDFHLLRIGANLSAVAGVPQDGGLVIDKVQGPGKRWVVTGGG